jgi:hypothetical protein
MSESAKRVEEGSEYIVQLGLGYADRRPSVASPANPHAHALKQNDYG